MLSAVDKYLSSDVHTPFFLVAGDENYIEVKNALNSRGFRVVNLSTYCGDDKRPDLGRFIDELSTSDHNHADSKVVVVGLGEYLALRGGQSAYNELSKLKDLNLHHTKAMLLLRSVTATVKKLVDEDRTRFDSRRVSFIGNGVSDITITFIPDTLDIPARQGMKALLAELEKGKSGNISVKSALQFEDSLLSVRTIKDAYDGVKRLVLAFSLPRSCGNDEQWTELLRELSTAGSLDAVLNMYGLTGNLETMWNQYIHGSGFVNWLYFISLKTNLNRLSNSYLRYVLENTASFDSFSQNVLDAITTVKHTDRRFDKFYVERKILIEKFSDPEVAEFVARNRKNPAESIYNLTDTKLCEREEIIACYSKSGSRVIRNRAVVVFPLLGEYLRPYMFDCGELSGLFSQYFEDYKQQKLSNQIQSQFDEQVRELATQRVYNRLYTRNEIFDRIDKDSTYLYWLDALGVEFLGFIQAKCKDLGLDINIYIAQVQLPTNTCNNRDFYDEWQGIQKEHDKRLDEIKHKSSSKYNYQDNKLPIHLAQELDIVAEVLNEAAIKLALRDCKKVLIASDHGASRLAVIKEQEEKYETDTKGEHSGRCCPFFEGCDLPFAAKSDNGYLVLADYGRFKGSRAANVEVHGGASLEEVVVPVIELRLKDGSIHVEFVETIITANMGTVAQLTIFSKSKLDKVSLVVEKKRYEAIKADDNHHTVVLKDIKRARDYVADVYEGDNLIERLKFTVQTGSGKKNDAFDDLF
ncbi:MAG TPA: BREX-4 system phosphatase PglZ [Desulfitobacteriaceae bacterium]|nr:BREX-4 system phosphatase PglZ [Desulfitobacteriaceae bacterium]